MIRHVTGSTHLLWTRRGLRVRYGYDAGGYVLWADWRWTHRAAMAELIDAMRAAGM